MPPRRPPKPRKKHPPTEEDWRVRKALGRRIYELRDPLYTQEEFAELIDVYRSHVSTIEQGKTDLRLSTLLRIASALKMPLHELLRPAASTES